ncbi:DNA cytosine methyltransferase [Burkholderia gladioli]|uniref:DNA cytosine methyltransferase n=1 Tax=Burkholderia gladioli TaxID=28095 RepID=UPI0016401DFD|nr:DNA cytosine methyltransferase [Burkholderia gladioli]
MTERKYRVISLFSGAMGLDLGMDATGRYEIVACVEKERIACDTIRKNQAAGRLPKELKVFEGDISSLDPADLLRAVGLAPGEVDLLIGGPPCQAFSTAGKRGTVQDPRGTLLWQFLRFVEHIRPRFFVMENVRGLVSAALKHRPIAERPEKGGPPLTPEEEPGSVIRQFSRDLQALPDAAYHMDIFEVNAVNYGAPQIRERVLFIGNRYNMEVDFPDPTHGPANVVESQSCLFDGEKSKEPWATLRDAIGGLNEKSPTVLDFSPRKKHYLDLVPPGSNWRSLPVPLQQESMGKAWHAKGGRSGWWRRLTFDLPCPTLMTMPNHASTALCHPIETRALSLREYARIQEFPDRWEFAGTVSEQYRQVGNAVPTRLGKVAGDVVASALDAMKSRKWRKFASAPEAFRIVYIQSHVRTRQWFKNGKTFIWDDEAEVKDAAYAPSRTNRKERSIA